MVTFATPLPQSTRSEILTWPLPRPFQNLVLTGRSRAAWHTSFVIPQLNLLLDAGLCVNSLRPKHVFLTHGHSDHTLLAPAFGKREDPPDVFCPVEMVDVFNAFCEARTMLNLGGGLTVEAEDDDDDDDENDEQKGEREDGDRDDETKNGKEEKKTKTTTLPKKRRGGILHTHNTTGLVHGSVVPLRRTRDVTALAFACDHTVPCLGYVFRQTTNKLRPEFASLSGQELRRLREVEGRQLTAPVTTNIFAFLGDTTAATLAADPEWLREGIPVVVTECSFLYEEHRAQAEKTKHTIWADLEKVVRRWPGTVFVLTHFSMRYTERDVRRFFRGLRDPPRNVVVWADGEEDG